MKLNLQFFAKDGPGGEKTEPATQKKLDDARKEGQVAKSKEIVNALSLLICFFGLKILVGSIGEGIIELFSYIYNIIPTYAMNADDMNAIVALGLGKDVALKAAMIILPILIGCFLINFIGELVQVGWKPTAKPLEPKFSKLNPISGFKKIFSSQSLINMLKSVGIVLICGYIIYTEVADQFLLFYNLYDITLLDGIRAVGEIVFDIMIKISAVYLVVGFVDLIYQRKKFKDDMMMTKQEVKDEYKNTEGDPVVKGQQRRRMREASQRRMMQALPEADVVITNPTHFAVAIKYDLAIAKAPYVIAKGEDFLAQKIKEEARKYNIEIYENKPLARALYSGVDIGQEIPQELYQAVAEVLAYVYNVKNKEVPVENNR
ncbi:MAG: flagellar biosynthesis protein FlhB [Lachnospiraceae bacterium]|nr:flagellar biosynthesis protein FlhB [Lachnospiraceae bacterium]